MTILILFLWITIESECKYMVFFNTTKIIAFFCYLKMWGRIFSPFHRSSCFSRSLPGEVPVLLILFVWVD